METQNTRLEDNSASAACRRDLRFSESVSTPPLNPSITMPYRRDSDAYYGREATGNSEYRGDLASTTFKPFFGGQCHPSEPFREEDAEPEVRRSAHVLRDPTYRYYARARREPYDQFGRVARSTASHQCGPSVDHPNYQNQAPRSSFEASYYGNRVASATSSHSRRESDVPSMIESESSTVENTWDSDLWNGKNAAAPVVYPSRRYSEQSKDEDMYENAKKPAAFGSGRLPVTKVASRNTKDGIMKSIEVLPGQFLRLRGADETWRAIACDFYMPCACVCCSLTLFCVQDACFVLCPDCRVISPMEGIAYEGHEGGVGLGFTMEELAKWQEDLERERRVARKK